MSIYLVRHGETDWNKQKLMQGREDIPLNENGILQAGKCARAFEKIAVKRIISSPLGRAAETARIIGEYVGITDVELDEDLTERDFGIFSGKPYEMRASYTDSDGSDGVESLEHLLDRMERTIRKYCGQEEIVIVSHGAAINAALTVFSKGEIGLGKTWLNNACISALQCSENNISIIFYNLTAEELIALP